MGDRLAQRMLTLVVPVALVACEPEPSGATPPPEPTPAPSPSPSPTLALEAVLLPENPDAPLVRELEVTTHLEAAARVTWSDGERVRTAESPPSTRHHLLLVRNRPDREITVTVELLRGQEAVSEELSFTTPPLPEPFPDIDVLAAVPERLSPGDTLLGLSTPGTHYAVVVDAGGEVVWWLRTPLRFYELQVGADGLLLGTHEGLEGIEELDWTGRVHRAWRPAAHAVPPQIPVEVDNFHHDVQRLEDGRLVAMTYDVVVRPTYPVSYYDPTVVDTDVPVREDRVVVLDPADGAITESYPLGPLLPPDRLGYGSLVLYGGERDWSHANGVEPFGPTGALLVSLRNQDALLAIDRTTGELRWVLGNPANWPPEWEAKRLQPVGAPFDWPYHQHAPEWSGDRVMVFDNGNERASPWTGEPRLSEDEAWSRVVEYRIDEAARTVEQAWAFEVPGSRLFSVFLGDADHLPNGDVLGLFGQVARAYGEPLETQGLGLHMARLVEFDPEAGELLWDLRFSSPVDEVGQGWNSFRAQRFTWEGSSPSR